jgi:SAM-dependent methyltransferase
MRTHQDGADHARHQASDAFGHHIHQRNADIPTMGTDQEWVKWGQRDPYFAVITNDKFRTAKLNDVARKEFFDSGRHHVNYVLEACRQLAGPAFAPTRALDFGCGVGRVTLPLAEQIAAAQGRVLGLDVSPDMLAEARRNSGLMGLGNAEFRLSDDDLSALPSDFDLVHSCITFQHIDVQRGRQLFAQLLGLLAPGGVGAIQITYAKACHDESYGQPPAPLPAPPAETRMVARSPLLARLGLGRQRLAEPEADPEMQMNPYNLSELAFMLQSAGVKSFQAQFTDHGGELGVFLYFRKS